MMEGGILAPVSLSWWGEDGAASINQKDEGSNLGCSEEKFRIGRTGCAALKDCLSDGLQSEASLWPFVAIWLGFEQKFFE